MRENRKVAGTTSSKPPQKRGAGIEPVVDSVGGGATRGHAFLDRNPARKFQRQTIVQRWLVFRPSKMSDGRAGKMTGFKGSGAGVRRKEKRHSSLANKEASGGPELGGRKWATPDKNKWRINTTACGTASGLSSLELARQS